MTRGIITKYYEGRFADRVTTWAFKHHLFNTDGYYPIIEDSTGKEVGAVIRVYGNRFVVRFLEWLSKYRGVDTVKVNVRY